MDRCFILSLLGGCLCLSSTPAVNAQSAAPTAPRYQAVFSTYLGGSEWEQVRQAVVYPDGSILVALPGPSATLPTTQDALKAQGGGCGYLARLSADGSKLISATYVWGGIQGMALDAQGNITIAGRIRSAVLPATPGCFQAQFGGGQSDIYVARLSPDMKQVLWATYLGGSGDDDLGGGLSLDGQGNVYLGGGTSSPNFPTTPGTVQGARKGPRDVFVAALKADGSGLLASTLLGGSAADGCLGVRVGPAGDIYVGGHTDSADFPTTPNAFQTGRAGKSDCFVTRLSSTADRLVYSTYLGGSQDDWAEFQLGLTPDGAVLMTGATQSPDFPVTPGCAQAGLRGTSDGFLACIGPDGQGLRFATLLGGSGSDMHLWPTPDAAGNILMVGSTQSRDYPTTADSAQTTFAGGKSDGMLSVISPDGSKVLFSTLLGGSGEEIIRAMALGPNGEVVLVGGTASPDFPLTANPLQGKLAGGQDAFIVKLIPMAGATR